MDQLTEDERHYLYFQQNELTVHTDFITSSRIYFAGTFTRISVRTAKPVTGHLDRLISMVIFYLLWKFKRHVYSKYVHTLQGIQQNIVNSIAATPQAELLRVSQNMINRA